ncbi:MAG TPA: acyl-CoA synthetase [Desulfocapsa sulfexigens]|nr:acyl-CoA synthetase [Desulfocapsa sulfexigens]
MAEILFDMDEFFDLEDVEVFLQQILQTQEDSEHDFTCSRATRADVYTMAAQLYAAFTELAHENREMDKNIPVCLAAEERSVIAAALLAALASGTVLVLPHSFSKLALEQMQETTGFLAAVVDVERPLSRSIQRISCVASFKGAPLPIKHVAAETELLQIFTGGSTGAPKIWSKTVGNIFGEALYMASRYQISDKDIIVSTVSPYHIYGLLFSVVIPLVSRATVFAGTPLFPAEIAECVARQSATLLVSIPAHYRVLKGRTVGPSLRMAFSSAGMLPAGDSLDFSTCNKVGVVEVYGSTETGGLATRDRTAGHENFSPLEPVIYKIQEERLYVKSPFLSPDISVNSDGFFLSGDRVHKEGENSFSLHGRADAVTKVGGVRVDLEEVRDLLQSQAAVKECVVVPLVDKTGRGNRIEALIRGEEADPDQLKKVLAGLLEPAALPRRIKVVSVIPLTSSGKYDREAINALLSDS